VEGLRVEEIFERLLELAGSSAVLMGMGNIGGQGLDLARYFKNREIVEPNGVEARPDGVARTTSELAANG
jgi:hypothetical protein